MEHNHMLLPPLDDPTPQKSKAHPPPPQQPPPPLPASLSQALSSPFSNTYTSQKASTMPSYPPPSYSFAHSISHEPSLLAFPDVPSAELAPIQLSSQNDSSVSSLPSLSTVTGTSSRRYTASSATSDTSYSEAPDPPPPRVQHWPSLNPLTAYYTPSHAQGAESPARMDLDMTGGNGMAGPASPDRWGEGRASSVSLDDPDVRMAAEALGDLRADFVSSPPNQHTPLPVSPPNNFGTPGPPQPEPLLSLLTTSHPLLAKTIEGTTSAYNSSKNFSPRFKTSAEYVEGYLTPIANTVGSVGRVTGVEGGVRWFLGAGRRHQSSDLESGDGVSHKRRKVDRGGANSPSSRTDHAAPDLYGFTKERRLSMSTVDTLPAYDELKSPEYSEMEGAHEASHHHSDSDRQATPTPTSRPSTAATSTAWQSRLIMSTSGLSIAMSEESLRSLKYCLRWLKWANEHIARVIGALKDTLEKYDHSTDESVHLANQPTDGDHAMVDASEGSSQGQGELAAKITVLKADVLKTLQSVIETVSKYTGGALPDNARELVRRHLTSLPQRFKLARQMDSSPQQGEITPKEKEQEVKEGAQRVLVLAKEGLDMMSQVSGVLDGTIVSAEEWCERLGKKKRDERDALLNPQTAPLTSVGVDDDVKMGQ